MILVIGGLADTVTELVCARLSACDYPYRLLDLSRYPAGYRLTGRWRDGYPDGAIEGPGWRLDLAEISSVYVRFLGSEGRLLPEAPAESAKSKRIFPALRVWLLTFGVVAMQPSLDVVAAGVIQVEKQKFEFTTFEDKPGLRVLVGRPRVIKLGGAYGLMGYRWVLEEGVYRDLRQVRIAGREYVMLPVKTISMDGGQPRRSGSLGSVGACYTADGEFIALDVETRNVLKRGFLRNKVAAHCGGGARIDWSHSIGSIVDDGDVQIAWGQDLVNAETRQAEFDASSAALAEQARNGLTLSEKRTIGARICCIEDGIRYIGFTEGASPENGKLRIRVADAQLGRHAGSAPGGFQPSIIWDAPDRWELCE